MVRRSLLLPLLVFVTACGDIAITQRPESEGDDPGECSDAADNDQNGFFDCEDPGCANAPECRPNQPPSAPEIAVEPPTPDTTDDLTCVFDFPSTDPDGDTVTYTFAWRVDGLDVEIAEPTVFSEETTKGEVWTCTVVPNDGLVDGPPASVTVTIANAVPTPPQVDITPGSPNVWDDLTCERSGPSVDPDGDDITYRRQWTRNGQPTGLSEQTISSTNTENNDVWTCHIFGSDDDQEGPPGEDSVEIHFDVFPMASAGRYHSCRVRMDGSFDCFGVGSGSEDFGQVDDMPIDSFGILTAGEFHTCGMRTDGSVACWGLDDEGQAADPIGSFVGIEAGDDFACGVQFNGDLKCWGASAGWPEGVPSGFFRQVTAGGDFACARGLDDGKVECWNWSYPDPQGIFAEVDAGGDHACAVAEDGELTCWGSNSHQQVGDAPTTGTWRLASAGKWHSCAIDTGNNAQCWGRNTHGQTNVPSGRYLHISAGWYHTCGIREDDSIVCWGCTGEDQGQCSP